MLQVHHSLNERCLCKYEVIDLFLKRQDEWKEIYSILPISRKQSIDDPSIGIEPTIMEVSTPSCLDMNSLDVSISFNFASFQ